MLATLLFDVGPGGLGAVCHYRLVALYDSIGLTYASTRRADPRVGAAIAEALGGAASVVNVGAGAGSYEPAETFAAIEPSEVMIAQRPPGSAPVLRAVAEQLPLRDKVADAAMASLTIHHWSDLAAGIAEMRRVARDRLVFLTWDRDAVARYWLLAEYLPEAGRVDYELAVPMDVLTGLVRNAEVRPLPIPHDCTDGFAAAFWRRPEAYLDPVVQAGMSIIARSDQDQIRPGLLRLAADLESGEWHRRHADLLDLDSLELGYYLVVAEP